MFTRSGKGSRAAASLMATATVLILGVGFSQASPGTTSTAKVERETLRIEGQRGLISGLGAGSRDWFFKGTPQIGKSERSSGLEQRSKKRKKRRWFMSFATARQSAARFARSVANNSRPSDVDDDPDLIGSEWFEWRTGRCLRANFSRVSCYFGVYSEDFDVVDEEGNIIGEDFYLCDGFVASWYPTAKRRSLRTKLVIPECLWASET